MRLVVRVAFALDGRTLQPGDRLEVAPRLASTLLQQGRCVVSPDDITHRDPRVGGVP